MATPVKKIPQLKPAVAVGDSDLMLINQSGVTKKTTFGLLKRYLTEDFPSARDVELRRSSGYIQWRYAGESSWINLVALTDITGPAGGLSSRPTTYFTGTGAQLVFSPVPGLINSEATKCIVTVGGLVQLANSSYTVSTDLEGSVIFDEAPPLGQSISVQIFQ